MKRLLVLVVLCGLAFSIAAQKRRTVTVGRPGSPLAGLSPSLLARFEAGLAEFRKKQRLDDGLGPVQNGRSCVFCHDLGGVGGGSIEVVTRFGKTTEQGGFDPMIERGGPVQQVDWLKMVDGSAHEFRADPIPPDATIVTRRRSPPLFGLGLVDATPDTTFIALAAEQAARNDGTAGRVPMVDNLAAGMQTAGKFGWKSQLPTLFQFAGDAYLTEIGITNPFFPNENCPGGRCEDLKFNPRPALNDDGTGTRDLADFMTLLAPPPRGSITEDVVAGEAVFQRIGCESCHVATLQTGPNEIPALDRVTYHPYSDFLLHDMGSSLEDNTPQGGASGREFRTPPLWGLRLLPAKGFPRSFLHHGRVHSIEAAVEGHDGQGRASRDRFLALDAREREQLLAFLRSL